jgi:hypothetical protein
MVVKKRTRLMTSAVVGAVSAGGCVTGVGAVGGSGKIGGSGLGVRWLLAAGAERRAGCFV